MEVEIIVWLITKSSGDSYFNRETGEMQKELTVDCVFRTPNAMESTLATLGPGYFVASKSHTI